MYVLSCRIGGKGRELITKGKEGLYTTTLFFFVAFGISMRKNLKVGGAKYVEN